jgi:hypothetical protein
MQGTQVAYLKEWPWPIKPFFKLPKKMTMANGHSLKSLKGLSTPSNNFLLLDIVVLHVTKLDNFCSKIYKRNEK